MASLFFRTRLRLSKVESESLIFDTAATPGPISFELGGGRLRATISGNPVRLELEVRDVDAKLESLLLHEQRDADTEALGKAVHEAILSIESRLRDHLRGPLGHYWLAEPGEIHTDPSNYDNALLGGEWLLGGNWHQRHVARSEGVSGIVRYFTAPPIDAAAWSGVQSFLASPAATPMFDVLLANARLHWSREGSRLALVEGVMALDILLRSRLADAILTAFGPTWVLDLTSALQALPPLATAKARGLASRLTKLATKTPPELDEAKLREILEDANLTPMLNDVVRAIGPQVGLAELDLDGTLAGVDLRNKVVHEGRRDVPHLDTHRYLEHFGRVVGSIR